MANRQRDFLMAANHYRAGRITIDEFREKVLSSIVAKGQVTVLTTPQSDPDEVKAAVEAVEAAEATVNCSDLPESGDLTDSKSLQKTLKSADAVVMIGLTDLATIGAVAKLAKGALFVVPDEKCTPSDLALAVSELPAAVAIVGKNQSASAARLAAEAARR